MTNAAFKATYAEWRVIKTRATVQLVFEIPIEQADQAYQALGGMPIAAREVWCGIARLVPEPVQQPETLNAAVEAPRPVPLHPLPAGAAKERRAFGDMRPAQQAGILCGEKAFKIFLLERFPDATFQARGEPSIAVRIICDVDSRRDITPDNAEWSALVLAYRLWQREPEVVPA